MLRIATYAVTLFLLLAMGSGSAFAADKIKKQDRKKDGSCQSYTTQQDPGYILAGKGKGKGSGDRDRKKDGSCQS